MFEILKKFLYIPKMFGKIICNEVELHNWNS